MLALAKPRSRLPGSVYLAAIVDEETVPGLEASVYNIPNMQVVHRVADSCSPSKVSKVVVNIGARYVRYADSASRRRYLFST